jgi:hypothetical protein
LAGSDSADEKPAGFGFVRPVVTTLNHHHYREKEKEDSDEGCMVAALGVANVFARVAISVVGFLFGSCSEMSSSSAEA